MRDVYTLKRMYVRVPRYGGDIDKHEVVKCVFGAYTGASRWRTYA